MDDASMHEAVAAIAACGVSPVVRVPQGEHWIIKRALDAGAHGIIVPLIETAEDAKNIAKYSKFPPTGNRGLGSPLSMEKFSHEITQMQYFQEANEGTLVILQIETQSALDQAAEIAAVPGVDVLFIGMGAEVAHAPADLVAALRNGGVAVESMASPTAARTYNVTLSEGRRVACALLPL